MRFIAISLAAAAIAAASPALANEARVEARGGVLWSGGSSEGVAGVAAGYDFDLGPGMFAGVEVSGDKVLESNTRVSAGIGGRVGAKFGTGSKIYAASSYQTKPCGGCEDSWTAGAGFQQAFGQKLYGKVEYRHFFVGNGFKDYNAALAGVGVKF